MEHLVISISATVSYEQVLLQEDLKKDLILKAFVITHHLWNEN